MSFESWVKNSWLEVLPSDAAEIARLLAIADARLVDYQKAVRGGLSTDVQLALAYDAARSSASAALRAAGYRVVRGNNEHYRTLEALEFSIDPEKKMIRALDTLRRKRNTGAYDDLIPHARVLSLSPGIEGIQRSLRDVANFVELFSHVVHMLMNMGRQILFCLQHIVKTD